MTCYTLVLLYEALSGCFPALPVSDAAGWFREKNGAHAGLAVAVTMTVIGPNMVARRRTAG